MAEAVGPERLGKYVLRRVLGKGAMGIVYEGYDEILERTVAIKTIRSDLWDSDDAAEMRERFIREARAVARMSHPNIVTLYEFDEKDGTGYIALEFVAGQTLKAHVAAAPNRRLEPREAITIAVRILEGLAYSHRMEVTHRDIKPGNVMLTPDGQVKILDFGVARLASAGITVAGAMLGTPAYMAPEQLLGKPVDHRADLYSVGVVLYEMLTGRKPHEGDFNQIHMQVLHTEPDPPSALAPEVTPELDRVVLTALAKTPEGRYADASVFAAALRDTLDEALSMSIAQPALSDSEATVVRPGPDSLNGTGLNGTGRGQRGASGTSSGTGPGTARGKSTSKGAGPGSRNGAGARSGTATGTAGRRPTATRDGTSRTGKPGGGKPGGGTGAAIAAMMVVVLIGGGAGGGWWWYTQQQGGSTASSSMGGGGYGTGASSAAATDDASAARSGGTSGAQSGTVPSFSGDDAGADPALPDATPPAAADEAAPEPAPTPDPAPRAALNADSLTLNSPRGTAPWYDPGETLTVSLRTDQPLYTYCFYEMGHGDIVRIFPTQFARNARVEPGETLNLPGSQPFLIRMDTPGEVERVACIGTQDDVTAQVRVLLGGGGLQVLPVDSLDTILATIDRAANGEAATDTLTVRVR
ncbi:serine/threonine-protein kinase [Roseospira marina]|nr:serine/threonine-protein kinase [Roseospira marina]MBB4315279.1 serine/threonine protein kinase [Roseospira marina]MBB5088278.1 serine/threonine protein kinase [Roseospira marina]